MSLLTMIMMHLKEEINVLAACPYSTASLISLLSYVSMLSHSNFSLHKYCECYKNLTKKDSQKISLKNCIHKCKINFLPLFTNHPLSMNFHKKYQITNFK